MIGSLVKFNWKKRELYYPSSPRYKQFHNQVGLVTSYSKDDRGQESVRVQWLKPVPYFDSFTKISDFPLLSFDIISKFS